MFLQTRIKASLSLIICALFAFSITSSAEIIKFKDSWGNAGYNLVDSDFSGVEVVFSIDHFVLENMEIDGQVMQNVILPGVIIPNDPGMPNLPGSGRYIAMPEAAVANLEILDYRTEVFNGLNINPAPLIPSENDDSPLVYKKDTQTYSTDSYYPASPVVISETGQMRGVDVVKVGITPFQYNPVTKELLVYRDIHVRINFNGGTGHFGEDRLRNRYWDPILRGNLLNYNMLPQIDYSRLPDLQTDEENVEYLIIIPDDPAFIAWADSIKQWRTQQGIITGVTTLLEIGGNNTTLIEDYIDNAYNNWEIPPAAFLLLSDHQGTADIYGIDAPIWDSYCASDNIYADVDGDDLPDIAHARITAQDEADLSVMVNKFLDYERNPPTDPGFYENPLVVGGWQDIKWFILCSEIISGFWENILEKNPNREYAIYSGAPGNIWSTGSNTSLIVDYFGPSGLGYIPLTPEYLTDWDADAESVNSRINAGAFMILHRDHGTPLGWVTPYYLKPSISGLNNENLPFIFSINCSSGIFNYTLYDCFTEALHRMDQGALGLIAATNGSFSFVNDTYVWGMWDSMWSDFDPEYGISEPNINDLRPCFANVYGKYYLETSNWPHNTMYKAYTYHLFHHHGDAFLSLYTEVPQNLTVTHNPVMLSGFDSFTVSADQGAIISLTLDNEIIAVVEATGVPQDIPIDPQASGSTVMVTVTKHNYYRYMQEVPVIPPSGPHVLANGFTVLDQESWNPSNELDYDETVLLSLTLENMGLLNAPDVEVTLTTEDSLLTIIDGYELYGTIPAGETVTVEEGFQIAASQLTQDGHSFVIDVLSVSGSDQWESTILINCNAPAIELDQLTFADPGGNNNNWLDPGEEATLTIHLINAGNSPGLVMNGNLECPEPYLTILSQNSEPITLLPAQSGEYDFGIVADISTPQEYQVEVSLAVSGEHGYTAQIGFDIQIGNILYSPSGPDLYGYLAYDPYDVPESPVFEWIEICADSGGSGIQVPFTQDDQTFFYPLPFDFQYYGVVYDTFTVGANGWIGMGAQPNDDFSNSNIPSLDGPSCMIAPYWEDLSPQKTSSGKVWRWYDSAGHRLIVEYNHIEQFIPVGSFETFQIILYDPEYYQTTTGDGRIKFQYKEMSEASQEEGTIGIENHTETDGIEYFAGDLGLNPVYDINASPLEDNFAILFTTPVTSPSIEAILIPSEPDILIPSNGGIFEYDLEINNAGTGIAIFEAWIETDMPGVSDYRLILRCPDLELIPGESIDRAMRQEVPGIAETGDYTYRLNIGAYPGSVYAMDEFVFTKTGTDYSSGGGDWILTGWDELDEIAPVNVIPEEYYLAQNSPNPFNPETKIAFGLPQAGKVELHIFNLLGQEVYNLQNSCMEAGHHNITFDAAGLSSGIYFYMLKTTEFTKVKKMLLVK